MKKDLAVIIHGGAGRIGKDHASKKIPALKEALEAAWLSLTQDQPGEMAVVAALKVLEGSEYFNAGYGGYPNIHGIVLTDVGLMRGNRDFVSIINCRKVKFPSVIALDMLSDGKHLLTVWTHEMMTNLEKGPAELKQKYGLVGSHEELIAPFVKEKIARKKELEVSASGSGPSSNEHGTVGCVVRDSFGAICAGTSTGGVSFKSNGRIGDTPVVGSGVYADSNICGLSTTGHGETFLKTAISSFVIAEMRSALKKDPNVFCESSTALKELIEREFLELEAKSKGSGAIIVIPPNGDPVYAFNASEVAIAGRTGSKSQVQWEDVLIDCKSGVPIR